MQSRLLLLLALCLSGDAFGWGAQGHEVIGAIADELLLPNASLRVQSALGMPLRVASAWADCVKDVAHTDGGFVYQPDPRFHAACVAFETPEGISRMEDYVARNWDTCLPQPGDDPCHKQYHYTDVAVEHNDYELGFAGTSDHDVVAAINAAITVLLVGTPAPAPFSIKDEKEALLVLAHLVGDLHQPLHVGAVYIDGHNHPTNPDAAGHHLDPKTETRGGNSITDGSTNLHAEWDQVVGSLDPTHITMKMINDARAVPATPGDITTWAQIWASDTVMASHTAFKGISYTHAGTTKVHWTAHFNDRTAYLVTKRKVQAVQLTKAGAHLAQILNSVWP
jgi:hypothetical protein